PTVPAVRLGRLSRPLTAGEPVGRPDPDNPQLWFARTLLLVLGGLRPIHVLVGHTDAATYDHLIPRAALAPLRSPGARPTPYPSLLGLGSCRPRPDVVEAFARVAVPERVHALAFRLGRRPRGWRCEAVDLGPLDPVTAGPRRASGNPPDRLA
ncbi:Rv3235 family protein, partial [Streptomyces calidiresistens]|uniref:Rv3235 family protein n=1 Tax=Streptomyces calidiresistens TaxID=1485586 RepID=UPI0015F93AC3